MCICKTYAVPMVSRAKDTHTTNRVVRIPDESWRRLAEVAGERHRARTIRELIDWYVGMPGAKPVKRPDPKKDKP